MRYTVSRFKTKQIKEIKMYNAKPAREKSILEEANENTHGNKERSFKAIADLWNAYVNSRKEAHHPLTEVDVAYMMMLMKLGRALHGAPIRDHFVDMVGYTAIAYELHDLETF